MYFMSTNSSQYEGDLSTYIRVFGELSDYPHVVHQIPHYPVPHVIVQVTCGLEATPDNNMVYL
jgi:hypothetical protein